ncbi:MAG TPA: SDR family oxidoreductase [Alphaproteobacteria bacterium]|nr:SDR family oxidoreductase [Alphaproteobacteria bacterium]
MTDDTSPEYGFTDDELAALATVYAPDLFRDKVVVVSGAGTGIGRGIAFLFARLGAKLAICGRRHELLDELAASLQRYSTQCFTAAMSIRDPDAVEDFLARTEDALGPLDILVNNAGGQFPQNALDFTVKGWNAVIDTNLNGTWYMMQTAAKRWRDEKRPGVIVNVIADFWRGMPQIAHTCAARAGVAYLSKSVAVEWAPLDIRVNCVAPGAIETTAFAYYPPEGSATFPHANPRFTVGDVNDIAEACVYLAAPSGKFITGEVLTVDGGQQLWGAMWPAGKPDAFKIPEG